VVPQAASADLFGPLNGHVSEHREPAVDRARRDHPLSAPAICPPSRPPGNGLPGGRRWLLADAALAAGGDVEAALGAVGLGFGLEAEDFFHFGYSFRVGIAGP
jgi:hypothetical protein